MKKNPAKVKTRSITFRVTEEQYQQIEKMALDGGKTANDRSRDLTIAQSQSVLGLSRNEQLIYRAVARLEFLLRNGFRLLALEELTIHEWIAITTRAETEWKEITTDALKIDRPGLSATAPKKKEDSIN